jgi:hypothetical protein
MMATDGSIWASEFPELAHFPASAEGDVTPTYISGAATGISHPMQISPDAEGNLWIGSPNNGSVLELPPTANGNAPFLRDISGANTGLTKPWGAAVYGFRPGKVGQLTAKPHHGAATLTWHRPAKTGGAIEGYVGQRRLKHHHKWHTIVGTKHRKFVDHSVKAGKHYFYRLAAINGFGYGKYRTVGAATEHFRYPRAHHANPSAPRHVRATPGRHLITVSWRAPKTDGGTPVTRYLISVVTRCTGGPAPHSCHPTMTQVLGSRRHHTFRHLTPHQRYNFHVRAGCGPRIGPDSRGHHARPLG